MNLVLLIQSGENGPVRIAQATDKNMRKTLVKGQEWSAQTLHIRAVLDGDERLVARLAEHFETAGRERWLGWYEAGVLNIVPSDVPVHDYDPEDEAQRVALVELRGMG